MLTHFFEPERDRLLPAGVVAHVKRQGWGLPSLTLGNEQVIKGEKIMATQILVPLTRHDRIEEIIPYVDDIAQPGIKVVFFVRWGVHDFHALTTHLLTLHTGIVITIPEGALLMAVVPHYWPLIGLNWIK